MFIFVNCTLHRSRRLQEKKKAYNGPYCGCARAKVDCTPSPYDTQGLPYKVKLIQGLCTPLVLRCTRTAVHLLSLLYTRKLYRLKTIQGLCKPISAQYTKCTILNKYSTQTQLVTLIYKDFVNLYLHNTQTNTVQTNTVHRHN